MEKYENVKFFLHFQALKSRNIRDGGGAGAALRYSSCSGSANNDAAPQQCTGNGF
jgi:hypothetical protein